MSRRTVTACSVVLFLPGLLAACASTGTGGGSSLPGREITAADLEGTTYTNAAEVLEASRRVFARGDGYVVGSRGRHSLRGGLTRDTTNSEDRTDPSGVFRTSSDSERPEHAIVELDGARLGSGARSVMESLSVESIAEIRILSASEAVTHYSDATNGLIIVKTKR